MTLPLSQVATLDQSNHHFRVYALDSSEPWLEVLATEYVRLRTECVIPLNEVTVEGIETLDVAQLRKRLAAASIPNRGRGNFSIIRSDFGETICYLVLEQLYGTGFGYKGVRDRELIHLPGRGIDAVGIERSERLRLVLGEVKVSNDADSPPKVVDRATDSLSAQHRSHLSDLKSTSKKVYNLARHAWNPVIRDNLLAACFCLDENKLENLELIACCVLVRSQPKYTVDDFGSFQAHPDEFAPALIRFLVVCIPEDVEALIDEWYACIERVEI